VSKALLTITVEIEIEDEVETVEDVLTSLTEGSIGLADYLEYGQNLQFSIDEVETK